MKLGILLMLLAFSFAAQSQSLKELLYSGKLKNDSNSVIRKTDDLSTKIDTSTKKIVAEPAKSKVADVRVDTVNQKSNSQTVSDVVVSDTTATGNTTIITVGPAAAPPAKTNNKIWKDYKDSLAISLKAEVLNSKKVKKETYFFMVDYELSADGKVNIMNVTVTPENAMLASQVKQIMETTPPQLNPAPDPNQKKLKKREQFSVTKE